jgi:hypothetical protein
MGILSRASQTGLKVIDKSDERAAGEAFARALTAFLDSERGGNRPPVNSLRWKIREREFEKC